MSTADTIAQPKWMTIAGWVMTFLPLLAFLPSAAFKLMAKPEFLEQWTKFGYAESTARPIGVVELLCVVIYLVPPTRVFGAILLTGYLGGAVSTHVRADQPFVMPILVGVVVWGGIFLRDARPPFASTAYRKIRRSSDVAARSRRDEPPRQSGSGGRGTAPERPARLGGVRTTRRELLVSSGALAVTGLLGCRAAPTSSSAPAIVAVTQRRVLQTLPGMASVDGAGVHLTRVIGQAALRHLDPFLLLDRIHSDDPCRLRAWFSRSSAPRLRDRDGDARRRHAPQGQSWKPRPHHRRRCAVDDGGTWDRPLGDARAGAGDAPRGSNFG